MLTLLLFLFHTMLPRPAFSTEAKLPAEVSAYLIRVDACDHWSGEMPDPADAAMKPRIEMISKEQKN
jgi:hypothetical protein